MGLEADGREPLRLNQWSVIRGRNAPAPRRRGPRRSRRVQIAAARRPGVTGALSLKLPTSLLSRGIAESCRIVKGLIPTEEQMFLVCIPE